jgi:serine protease Do
MHPKERATSFTSRLRSSRRRNAIAAALLGATALAGVGAIQVSHAADSTAPITPPALAHALPDFTDLVTHVKPAVVSITTEMTIQPASAEGTEMPFGMMPQMPQQRPRAVQARGSGFIIDADGTVVTNNHVVKDAKSVKVTLDDGTQLPAKIVGRDARTDLAVLKVDAGRQLPFIQLGNSDEVKPGQWVIAMGNPFGLDGTVTAGIVSARGRDIGSGPYDDFIQIDAPVNQGNSGGPLFTQDGRVVGVNSAILSPSGGSVGIGFAIPANMVKEVVAELQRDGHITRGYLGVESQPVTPTMAGALHLPKEEGKPTGALIAGVEANSPASKAGLQPGDVVTSVNGQTVKNPHDLAIDIANIKPGSDATLDVLRDGSAQKIAVAVTGLPSTQTAENGSGKAEKEQASVGLALAPLSPDMRDQLDLPAKTKGAVVAEVKPGSLAEEAGIKQGDVIVGVGEHAVNSPEEAAKAIRASTKENHAVALRVLRDGHTAFVAIDTSKGNTTDNG